MLKFYFARIQELIRIRIRGENYSGRSQPTAWLPEEGGMEKVLSTAHNGVLVFVLPQQHLGQALGTTTTVGKNPPQNRRQRPRRRLVKRERNLSLTLRLYQPGLRIRIRIGSGFNRVSGSGSRRAKMTHKSRNFFLKFMFWSVGWPLLRAEGFFCNLDVLYGGLGIGKL